MADVSTKPLDLAPSSNSKGSLPIGAHVEVSICKSRYRSVHINAHDLGAMWATRSAHSLHTLVPRLGGFPPGLPRWVIETFSRPGDTVLDPFCGKGTAPLEALLTCRHAIGNDAAPDAFVITHAKLSGVNHARAIAFLERLHLSEEVDLASVPRKVRIFFHDDTLRQILLLRQALFRTLRIDPGQIEALATEPLSDEQIDAVYILACLLGCLHGPVDYRRNRIGASQNLGKESIYLSVHCNHTYSASPEYVMRYCQKHGLVPPVRNVISSILRKSALAQADALPELIGQALCGPAQDIACDGQVDLIVTSPPYFRAQTYAWDNWLRLWCLGYEDYRQVASKLLHTDSVAKYYAGILESVTRIKSLLGKRNAYVAIVVGDVTMRSKANKQRQPFLSEDERMERYISRDETRGLVINTSEIIADVGTELGFNVELIANDLIPRNDRALASFVTARQGTDVERIVVLRNSVG